MIFITGQPGAEYYVLANPVQMYSQGPTQRKASRTRETSSPAPKPAVIQKKVTTLYFEYVCRA